MVILFDIFFVFHLFSSLHFSLFWFPLLWRSLNCYTIYIILCISLICIFKFQIGASFHLTNVQVYVVDLKECKPFGNTNSSLNSTFSTSPFNSNTSLRKSFSKADRPLSLKTRTLDVKTIEESTSGTDPEEESMADITNMGDYKEIFKGRGCKYI